MDLPAYDELYAVSDLHLGGEQRGSFNFQVFHRGERLSKLIRHLGEPQEGDRVALVINGDLFDSLAESAVCGYIASDGVAARRMIERLFGDPSFAPVWEALRFFIAQPKRYLILVLGNHDLELTLPPVESALRQYLAQGDRDRDSRLIFSTRGHGFTCRVGKARVFCTHGNEVDDWNWVDYNALGQLGNAINAGRRIKASDWQPNAGTRLVVDVINEFKRRYPFIDLLKPETHPVIGVLLSLDPGALEKIELLEVWPILRAKWQGKGVTSQLLSAHPEVLGQVPVETAVEAICQKLLGPALLSSIEAQPKVALEATEDELLLEAGKALVRGDSATQLALREDSPETLGGLDKMRGWIRLIGSKFRRMDPIEALRLALKDWLHDDESFDVTVGDETFRKIVDRVGPDLDFVITGHTHLARAIPFASNRFYFNSGTWIRLLQLNEESLADGNRFKQHVYPALKSGRMDDLDRAVIPTSSGGSQPLLLDRTHVVRIRVDNTGVTGELLRVTDSSTGPGLDLGREPNTDSFKV